MRYLTLCLLLCLTGCSVLRTAGEAARVEITGPPAIEPAPLPPEPLLERVREQVAYAQNVLAKVWWDGVEAADWAVMSAREGLAFVAAHQGAPTHVPDDTTVAERLEDGQERLDAHRAALDDWWADMAEAAREPMKRSWSIGSPLLGTKFLLGGLGLSGVGLLGVAGWLWRKGKKLAVALALEQGHLSVLVKGVQAVRATMTSEQRAATGKVLSAVEGPATEARVREIKGG